MSNIQITKRCENATADKSNVNPLLIPRPIGQRNENDSIYMKFQ